MLSVEDGTFLVPLCLILIILMLTDSNRWDRPRFVQPTTEMTATSVLGVEIESAGAKVLKVTLVEIDNRDCVCLSLFLSPFLQKLTVAVKKKSYNQQRSYFKSVDRSSFVWTFSKMEVVTVRWWQT